ncbi:Na+/H+ antiporter NhaA [Oerskovia turbata]|uniref:Na(+)/H(+) antiporter NhaA n=1 Tax=Oerskovia turbata TaxID=1713 RepID=A0A4V1N5Q6_9CELL|nr:Na+/H+ antiporter NhaA [Oerskovia turbata]RXR26343.1 Na+/H+ antiporter NhaA [Oerskovia turbata]RXR36518.1 Na+/H+ antiporter NhaA [Oerskovia turbata]TGJ97531.1 Na+/H+ antiporter NhaA [Actinotalea fermentans ATCC 43279 = JCM 9966 = DSM 3133]
MSTHEQHTPTPDETPRAGDAPSSGATPSGTPALAATARPSAARRWKRWVTRETTGGALLIGAAIIALLWANSPWREAYFDLASFTVGPEALHLDLSLSTWAADGLLAIFFFVVGVELKQEFVAGSLRNPREAGVPMLAAVGGMLVPAAFYVAVVLLTDGADAVHGWAIPTATDIAFALAVLAVFGRGLPTAIRTFLLTLAVVDDLLAIIVIAIFYTDTLHWAPLGLALVGVALFAFLVRRRRTHWWLLLPLAAVVWALVHESGIHATVAGVLLGFMVPALAIHGEKTSRTHQYEHRVKPISAGLALPIFAFFAAGVSLVDGGGIGEMIGQPVAIGIIVGLVVGKGIGVLGITALVTRLTPLRLAPGIGVRDLLPVGLLAGIGFTVSLLIAELSFPDSEHTESAKAAVLLASVASALLAAAALRWDARRKRSDDMNEDGLPDDVSTYIGDAADDER